MFISIPVSWAHYKETGEFRSGTIIVKELVSVGTKKSASGNGYFQGDFLGIAATVKDKKRFADRPNNWAYFGFGDRASAAAEPDDACAACHKANAAQDMVFTQHYPVLRPLNRSNKRYITKALQGKKRVEGT